MAHLKHVFCSCLPHLTICLDVALEGATLFFAVAAEISTVQKSHDLFIRSPMDGQPADLPLSKLMRGTSPGSSLRRVPGEDQTEPGCEGAQTSAGTRSLFSVCLAQGYTSGLVQEGRAKGRNKAEDVMTWELGAERKG